MYMTVCSVPVCDMGIAIASSKFPTEETHCLNPSIPVHISRRCFVDQPVTGEVPVNILGIIYCLVNNHRWHEALSTRSGEYRISTL